ncbi:MAG TPA: glycosyltransferase [Bacteroidia bacterium]|nr:glycosyltransferase [Bacteroidia bacterium]HRS58628.1 glycosyltransferase [Bacteroidia bacterium]HRU67835.1 glycosyltransferase [Bacteroidia bacterium]
MRIAYLSTFYPFRGGITHFNQSLLAVLSKNHDTQAFTFKRQYPELLFPGKTQYVTENDLVKNTGAVRVLDTVNPLSYQKTVREISSFKPDLLLMKYWMPFFAPSLGYVAGQMKKRGCKVISILDNVVPHEKKFYDIPLTKYFLKRNSGFVVMSETVKNDLLSLLPDAAYIFQSHPLYNHFGEKISRSEACRKLNIPEDRKIILFFGFIRDYKGLDILIEAMTKLPEDYFLLIAGEVYGDDNKYTGLIRHYGIEEKVQVNLRYIADHEVSLFFSASDVNVLPYRSATQSGILSIAYHFEVPVVVTDTGSLKDSVEPEGTGLVAAEATPEHLSNAILSFFRDEKSVYYAENIRKLKKKYSWEALAGAIVNFSMHLD